MDNDMWIGVVTVTFNSGRVIRPFIDSVKRQTGSLYTVYVVDNASSDDTLAALAEYGDLSFKVIKNINNLGVAEGNSQGIDAAIHDGCDYILLLNNDVEFGPTLFRDLLDGLTVYSCDMIVPKMYYFDDPNRIWCAGGEFKRLRGYAPVHFGEGDVDQGQFDVARPIEYCPTCCMLIKRQVFDKIGGMDPKYFVYWDDTDFCFRALKANICMYYLPTTKLWHKVSSLTGGTTSLFSLYYYTRNKVYFLLKNRPLYESLCHLVFYWIYILVIPIFGPTTWTKYRERQKAFFAGIALFIV